MKQIYKKLLAFTTDRDKEAVANMGDFIRNSESITPQDKETLAELATSVRDRMADQYQGNSKSFGLTLKGVAKTLAGVAMIAAFPASAIAVVPAVIVGASGLMDLRPGAKKQGEREAIQNQKDMVFDAEKFSNMVSSALKNAPDTPENKEIKEAIKRQGGDMAYMVANFGIKEVKPSNLTDRLDAMRDKNEKGKSLKMA